jgi:hypothetical protein
LRYNISTGDFPLQGYDTATTIQAGFGAELNFKALRGRSLDNNARVPSYFPIWEQYGLTFADVNGSFVSKRIQDDDPDNDNDGRDGGIKKALPVSRDYTLRNNPQVRNVQKHTSYVISSEDKFVLGLTFDFFFCYFFSFLVFVFVLPSCVLSLMPCCPG